MNTPVEVWVVLQVEPAGGVIWYVIAVPVVLFAVIAIVPSHPGIQVGAAVTGAFIVICVPAAIVKFEEQLPPFESVITTV